jgi:hypothetical protein
LTALVAVLGLTTVMWIAPYRVLMQSEMNRVNLAGQRCFSLGHEAASTLVYCPDSPQPKVHHVADGDPTLEDAGFTQSVFSPQ